MTKNATDPTVRSSVTRGRAAVEPALRIAVRIVVAVGLIADAWIHFDLASHYDVVRAQISEGTLFRLESLVAAITALLVIAIHRRITLVLAFLVAGSAVAALLLSTYSDPGQIGPLPDMYEPTWFTEKSLALVAELVAAGAALIGVALETRSGRHRRG